MKNRMKRLGILGVMLVMALAWSMTGYLTYNADMHGLWPTSTILGEPLMPGMLQTARDPCANPNVMATNAAFTTTVTGQFILGTSGKVIYVCEMNLTAYGTGTYKIVTGTGSSTCATSAVSLTGSMPVPATAAVVPQKFGGSGKTALQGSPGMDMCINITGTVTMGGWANYILGAP